MVENAADQTLDSCDIDKLHIAFLPIIVHVQVIFTFNHAVFDGCKDDCFGLIKLKFMCCWHSDEYDVLNLAIKCLEFEFWFFPALVRKLVNVQFILVRSN